MMGWDHGKKKRLEMKKLLKLTSDFPVPVDPRMTTIGADGGLWVDILATHLIGDLGKR